MAAIHDLNSRGRGGKVGAPSAETGDVERFRDGAGLQQEALDRFAGFERGVADGQRGGHSGDESAKLIFRDSPDFDLDAWTLEALVAHQAGLGRSGAGQGIKTVIGCGPACALEARTAFRELMVQWLAPAVRTDDREGDAAGSPVEQRT